MKLYCGIDLHSNNSVVVLIDDRDRVVYSKRLPNDLTVILSELKPFSSDISGIAVESTFNWYWLVDGLMSAGYKLHLVNTAAVIQYKGLKYADDCHDARWLAHLLRLGILPEGYIYPREERPVRDLLRKRGQMVQQRTRNLLSIKSLIARSAGLRIDGYSTKKLTEKDLDTLLPDPDVALAAKSNLRVYQCLEGEVRNLEEVVLKRAELRPEYELLLTVDGIGKILALTIMLEVGDIGRFPTAGKFASYCRCVRSERISNKKKKGSGNAKNGNRYLAWAFVEAANFSIRYNDLIKGFYQRKKAKRKFVVAIKAVANKLSKACYYILKDQVPFDVEKSFSH